MPGEIWYEKEIKAVVDQIHAYGFDAKVVESVNVHDDIKIGRDTRDELIIAMAKKISSCLNIFGGTNYDR